MKVWIVEDELYPVYGIERVASRYAQEIEVDAETLARWQAVDEAWDAVQQEIYAAIQAGKSQGT